MSLRDRAERMSAGPPVRRAPCEIGNSRSFADRHDRRQLPHSQKRARREQYCTDSAGNRALNADRREALPYALDVLRNIEKPPVSGPGVFFVTRGLHPPSRNDDSYCHVTHGCQRNVGRNPRTRWRHRISSAKKFTLAALREDLICSVTRSASSARRLSNKGLGWG